MPKVTLAGIRFSAISKVAAEKHKLEVSVPYMGQMYKARIDVISYPRIEDGDEGSYTFECESLNASMRRLRRVYAALGGRMNPPWTSILVDGQEINGNRNEDSDD
jgi:hypothetical protein